MALLPLPQECRNPSHACTSTFLAQLAPWECSSSEGSSCWFLSGRIITGEKGSKSLEVLFDNVQVGLDSSLLLGLVFDAVDVVVDCLHDLVVLAGLLVELDAEVEEDELEDVLLVFTAAVLQLVLQLVELFLLAVLGWQEGLPDFSVDEGNFFVGVLFFQ